MSIGVGTRNSLGIWEATPATPIFLTPPGSPLLSKHLSPKIYVSTMQPSPQIPPMRHFSPSPPRLQPQYYEQQQQQMQQQMQQQQIQQMQQMQQQKQMQMNSRAVPARQHLQQRDEIEPIRFRLQSEHELRQTPAAAHSLGTGRHQSEAAANRAYAPDPRPTNGPRKSGSSQRPPPRSPGPPPGRRSVRAARRFPATTGRRGTRRRWSASLRSRRGTTSRCWASSGTAAVTALPCRTPPAP